MPRTEDLSLHCAPCVLRLALPHPTDIVKAVLSPSDQAAFFRGLPQQAAGGRVRGSRSLAGAQEVLRRNDTFAPLAKYRTPSPRDASKLIITGAALQHASASAAAGSNAGANSAPATFVAGGERRSTAVWREILALATATGDVVVAHHGCIDGTAAAAAAYDAGVFVPPLSSAGVPPSALSPIASLLSVSADALQLPCSTRTDRSLQRTRA